MLNSARNRNFNPAKVSIGLASPTRAVPPSPHCPLLIGIPFAGFALFWISTALHATQGISRSPNAFAKSFSIFPVFGVPFLLIGLGIILAPLWAYLKALNTVYGVTDKRVLIITGTNSRAVKSYTPADIVSVEHRERPDGSGDVLIRTTPQMRTNNSSSQIAVGLNVGLYGVANVKEVARYVMNLHTQQRPAAP